MRLFLFIMLLLFSGKLVAQETRIAFGSCANQKDSLFIFDTLQKHHPETFIFLGDNVYLDNQNKDTICLKYDSLAHKSAFQRLKATTPILATWDDHDYGLNDAGKELPFKELSKIVFLDFFGEAACSNRWKHEGIYDVRYIKQDGLTIQILLLDTRTFRDSLTHFNGGPVSRDTLNYWPEYSPNISISSELLGEAQWVWLETQLMMPADVRVVCSSIQFAHSFNGYESWNNFPFERKRFVDLITCTQASGVVFISGDVHLGEISKSEIDAGYPLYDITSSGLSMKWHAPTYNLNRIAGPVMQNNFGLLTVKRQNNIPTLKFQLIDVNNESQAELSIPITDLQFK